MFDECIKKMMPGLTDKERKLVLSKCTIKKLRKKEMLLREGEICHCKTFVTTGLLRNYSRAENGYEYVIKFTDAGGWTTDPESYNSGLPSAFNIDAIEASEVMMWSRDNFETLKLLIPSLIAYSEAILTKNISLTQRRILLNISATPEEKYVDFINSFPTIFHRVPLHMVASYLGVSRETLTRTRQVLAVTKAYFEAK